MYGIKEIIITITNAGISNNIILFLNDKKAVVDNNTITIDDEKVENLIRIIRTWKNTSLNSNIIDDENYIIKIISNNGEEIIKGKANSTKDYEMFKNWLGDLYD